MSRKHEPAVVQELPEKVELLRRELNLLVAHHDFAAARVDVQVSVLEGRALELAPFRIRPPEDRFHTSDELAWIKGLREVVARDDLETDDLLDVVAARC